MLSIRSISIISIINILPLTLRILDIVLSNEQSSTISNNDNHDWIFVKHENDFYIILHTNATIIIQSIVLIAAGTLLIAYLKHVCRIFELGKEIRVNK